MTLPAGDDVRDDGFPAPSGADEQAQLSLAIDTLMQPTQGTAGVAYRIVETGENYQLRGDEAFPMASVYKFPMALAWLHQVDTARVSLDDTIVLTESDLSPYHSPLAEQFSGTSSKHTVLDLITRMIETSDNTACDVLLSRLGGPAAVQENLGRLRVLGLEQADEHLAWMQENLDTMPMFSSGGFGPHMGGHHGGFGPGMMGHGMRWNNS